MPDVTATDEAPPFEPAWFDTVFLVPRPPAAWPRAFAVVTAHNPGGIRADDDANRRRQSELDEYLRSEGLDFFRVVGASPGLLHGASGADSGHREAGCGFAASSFAQAAAVAALFDQAGFYWVEDGVVFICTDGSGRGWRVARWDERLVREDAGPGH